MGTVIVDFASGDQMLCQWSWALPFGTSATISGLDVLGPDGVIRQPRRETEEQGVVVVSKPGGQEERHLYPTAHTSETWYGGQAARVIRAIPAEGPAPRTVTDRRQA